VFAEQPQGRFGPTYEAAKSRTHMGFVKYHRDIGKSVPEMAYHNIHARVTGIACRKIIKDEIPEAPLRRLALRENINNGEWLDTVRTVTRPGDDFRERKGLLGGGPSGTTRAENSNCDDSKPAVAAKGVQKQYTAKEKADNQKKQAGDRKVKKEGLVAPAGEVKQSVWAEAHKGVDQKVVDKRKSDNESTRFGIKNHAWKYGRKPAQVSAVYRGQAKPIRQSTFAQKRCPQVATVAADGLGASSKRSVPRPPAWGFDDDDILYKVIKVLTSTVFG